MVCHIFTPVHRFAQPCSKLGPAYGAALTAGSGASYTAFGAPSTTFAGASMGASPGFGAGFPSTTGTTGTFGIGAGLGGTFGAAGRMYGAQPRLRWLLQAILIGDSLACSSSLSPTTLAGRR